MNEGRSAYRRTKRTAIAVAATALVVALATEPGAAAPGQSAFSKGTGSATALGYKVNPTNGNLSFGITIGESVAGHQNTGATGQSRAINLGVIGVTLAGEGCDGGDPTLAEEKQPQALVVRSSDDGASEGKHEAEYQAIDKYARATVDPFAEAITTIAPLGDPAAVYVSGGRTITHSGIVGGDTREALARTELGTISIGGGAIEIQGMAWEAIHRSGAVSETLGSFTLGTLVIAGQAQSLPGDGFQQAAALKDILAPLGIAVTPPVVRVEQGIVFVDPLKIAIVPSAQRDSLVAPLIGGLQPVRESLADALLDIDCGNSTYITLADIALGSVSGAGALGLELGGVQATTGDFTQFKFGALPALAAPPPVAGLSSSPAGISSAPARPNVTPTPAAPQTVTTPGVDETVTAAPISGIVGERGGLMALIGGGGLVLLLATAEADRRKMQHALRQIPLEA